jgi:hypothetical protein
VQAPDFVGNIRIDQAWGLFQISGAVHEVNGSYNILNGSLVGLPGTTTAIAPPPVFGANAPAGATGLASAAPINAARQVQPT